MDDAADSGSGLFFEDIVIGQAFRSPDHTVRQSEFTVFADLTHDQHPIHTDPAYCATTPFGRPIAHGLYTLALMAGLKTKLGLYRNTSIASVGWNAVRFSEPMFAGDTVHAELTFADKRPTSKADRGIVIQHLRMVNQRGEVVLEADHIALILRKQTASQPES